MEFRGAYTALITPFTADGVDFDRLRALVDRQIELGIDGVVPCGTTGESPTLSHDEHRLVVETVIDQVAGRVPVIAGTGSNSTTEAIELSRHAAGAGANALLVITPYYNKPTQEGLFQHFKAVACATDLPIVLYNVPGRTGVSFLPETVRRLAVLPSVVAIKEASGSLDFATEMAAIEGMALLSGDDSLTLPLLAVGGKGVIAVISNLLPGETSRLVKVALDGDFKEAARLHHKFYPLCKALFAETNPGPVKAAMALLGLDSGRVRLPLVEVRPETRERLRECLVDVGLL